MTTPNRPSIVGPVPFSFKLAVMRQQLKNFSRYLRFYWKSLSPACVTPQGFKFHGNRHMIAGTFEPEETRLVGRMLDRADVFITNVFKCRPPVTRDPLTAAIAACQPYLDAKIEAIDPRMVVTLGR